MALEQRLYMNTPTPRAALRETLAGAGIGFEALSDFEHLSEVITPVTIVTITERDDPVRPWSSTRRLDNGVVPNRSLCFRCRDKGQSNLYQAETVRGVAALLKAYPQAEAYLLMYDAAIPTLLYKDRRLILAEQLARDREIWDMEHQPYQGLVDLPYEVAPLGPWTSVEA